MDRKLTLVLILLVTSLVVSTHNKELNKTSHNITDRQQIFQQSGGSQVAPIGKEVQKQLREQLNSDLRDVGVAPSNADEFNGLTNPGIGLPFGTSNRRIDKNPLIRANGLTKSSLDNIMFGNLRGLMSPDDGGRNEMASLNGLQPDSVRGGDMRQMVGMNNMGNVLGNTQTMNLNALATLNNLAAAQGLNAFGTRNGALFNMINGGNMNSGNVNDASMNLNEDDINADSMNGDSLTDYGLKPNFYGNLGTEANNFGGPIQPNPILGLQLMSQLSKMKQDESTGKHHKRHHSHHNHHKHQKHKKHHNKSKTKLLLRLLVDKLKDIYELDQLTASNKKLDSATVGKNGLNLEDIGIPKGEVHGAKENKSNSLISEFKTKLSFPLAISEISDNKAKEELHLTDEGNRENFHSDIPTDDDDAKIQKILSGFGIKEGTDSVNKINGSKDSTENILKDIQTASVLDAKAKAITSRFTPEIKGQETKTESAKSRNSIANSVDEELKNEEEGSLSEFHKIKLNSDLADASYGKGAKSNVQSSEIKHFMEPQNGEVTAPQIFSMSSLLNNDIDEKDPSFSSDSGEETPIHDKSLKILGSDASKKASSSDDSSNEKGFSYVPSDIITDQAYLKSLTDMMSHDVKMKVKDGENYVKAARVLGAVFMKVKDPVAKKSIETAIKAMLQVMKNSAQESNPSRKHHLPSDNNAKLVEQIQRLNETYYHMKKNLLPRSKEKRSFHMKKVKKNKITLISSIQQRMLNNLKKS